jgi:hypothetical protein
MRPKWRTGNEPADGDGKVDGHKRDVGLVPFLGVELDRRPVARRIAADKSKNQALRRVNQ